MNEAADALEEMIKEFENLQFLFHATYNRHVAEIKELESKLEAKSCGKRIDPIVVDLKTGWFEPK